MPKDGGQISRAVITLVNQAVWLLESYFGRQICKFQDCSPRSSVEHLQLIKPFLQVSSLSSWCGYTSFKEKVELSSYYPQRWPRSGVLSDVLVTVSHWIFVLD